MKIAILIALAACGGSSSKQPLELASARGAKLDLAATQPPAGYDPMRLAKASVGKLSNEEPNTPPPCYEKTEGKTNGCASCHTHTTGPNFADDWELQMNYSFSPYAKVNHWQNQMRERGDKVAKLSDADVLGYVRHDNYQPLTQWLAAHPDEPGYHPDLDFAKGFDGDGFANDGSGWRALRYKPFTTFWASNGSADDVFVRLPAEFRVTATGEASPAIYRTNLAILEAAITATTNEATRDIEPIDERVGGLDLDGDGQLATATRIVGIPEHFVGKGQGVRVTRALYPRGTEFLHTVRYLDPARPGYAATRMKEVRYAKKTGFFVERELADKYTQIEEAGLPAFTGDPLTGLTNAFSWNLQGYIEDAHGWLRKQTNEEHQFCMGCHTGIGVTVDQTFAFARKVPGAEGWKLQDPTAIADAPQLGRATSELADYIKRTGASEDVAKLPVAERAIALDRAYLANVIEQSYVWGRDAITSPQNVHATITERSTGLGEADRLDREVQLHLQWAAPSSLATR